MRFPEFRILQIKPPELSKLSAAFHSTRLAVLHENLQQLIVTCMSRVASYDSAEIRNHKPPIGFSPIQTDSSSKRVDFDLRRFVGSLVPQTRFLLVERKMQISTLGL